MGVIEGDLELDLGLVSFLNEEKTVSERAVLSVEDATHLFIPYHDQFILS